MSSEKPVTTRVRFAPSPTGYLHIGGARTALFNWLIARRHGGVMVLRIEDTDQSRQVDDSVEKITDDLRWLGLNWDEGPEIGGDYGPYFQSRRLDLYNQHIEQLLSEGKAYFALESQEELQAMRKAAELATGGFRYPRPDPLPTVEQGLTIRNLGKNVVVRLKMPDSDITVVDEILGSVTIAADQHEDFVIQKGDGFPTYHLACVVDDELMKISHVLRGQEHLMNTPKHVALQQALGFSTPRYAHLPVIFNMNGSKMSKRDKEKAAQRGETAPEIDVHDFRAAGFLPETIDNFIALLGWNPGDEREYFTLDELAGAFSLERVGKSNARFDREKLLAFNTHWAACTPPRRLLEAFDDFLTVTALTGEPAGSKTPSPIVLQPTGEPPTRADMEWMLEMCAGFRTFPQILDKTRFLFTPDDAIVYAEKAVKKVLMKNEGAGYAMLETLLARLESQEDWSAPAIETLLQVVCEERETKFGNVAQPLRVAITGSTISPSIHESLSKLGKPHTIARIKRCIALRAE